MDWASPIFKGFGSVKWLKSRNWLRSCDSLFLGFSFDFCLLNLALFHMYRLSKNSVSILFISLLGTPWPTNQHHSLHKWHYSDCCFDTAVCYGSHTHDPITPIAFRYPRSVTAVPSHCEVWPTEKSDHRALQRYWDFPDKFISHSLGKRYFWMLPVWVSGS